MSSNYRRNQKRREQEEEWSRQRDMEVQQRSERWNGLWDVPEAARDEYLALEDAVGESGAQKILAFVRALSACS